MARTIPAVLAAMLLAFPAAAQQNQQWFVPGQQGGPEDAGHAG